MLPTLGFKPLNLQEIEYFDNWILYYVGNYLFLWCLGKFKCIDIEMAICSIKNSQKYIIITGTNHSKKWMVCLDKIELAIVKRMELDGDLIVDAYNFIIFGKNIKIYNFENFRFTAIDLRPEKIILSANFLIAYTEGMSHLYIDKVERYKVEGQLIALSESVFIIKKTKCISVRLLSDLNAEILALDYDGELFVLQEAVVLWKNMKLSLLYPIQKELIVPIEIKDIRVDQHIVVTNGMEILFYKLTRIKSDYILSKLRHTTFPLLKHLNESITVNFSTGYVYGYSENYIFHIDLYNYEFSISKSSYISNFTFHPCIPLLYSHENSTVSSGILSQNVFFENSSLYVKGKSNLRFSDSCLISYSEKFINFRNIYDMTLLGQYPFKLTDNTCFKMCASYFVVYSDKTVSAYKLYSFKKQDDYISDQKILDAYYNEAGLLFLTAKGFYQVDKREILLEYSLQTEYDSFIFRYINEMKAFVILTNLRGFMLAHFTVTGKRLLVDHSKTVTIEFTHIKPLKWITYDNALVVCNEGFVFFQFVPKLYHTIVSTLSALEHHSSLVNSHNNHFFELELQSEYDQTFIQESFDREYHILAQRHNKEKSAKCKISEEFKKKRGEELNVLQKLMDVLLETNKSNLITYKDKQQELALVVINITINLEQQTSKDVCEISKVFSEKFQKQNDISIESLAQETTTHFRNKNKLSNKIEHMRYSADSFQIEGMVLVTEMQNLVKNSAEQYHATYEELKRNIYPHKSLVTVLEKRRLNLLHALDLSKIRLHRMMNSQKELVTEINLIKLKISASVALVFCTYVAQ
eukprot:NODE_15_length_42055_cov_0.634117.p4 type:complete len:808 gc:universal NODE_15_length_42055_cov_0.634117:18364-15941(-)